MPVERKQLVSKAVIQRMPRYYRNICELRAEGVQRISSRALAERMGLTASQIRQDFNCFGGFGQQGYGYNVDKLQDELGSILGLRAGHTAVLVGAGNLGRALLNNFDFSASGFRLLCAFDANAELVGQKFGGHEICNTADLYDFVRRERPDVAILTLSRRHAPDIARALVDCGIRGLWNFTGEDLHLEGLGIPVENVHLSDSMMMLCHMVIQDEELSED